MSIDAAFWLFFMLPLVCLIIGGFVWEALSSMMHDHNQRLHEVRELRKLNHDLRDELERLRNR